jgi:hypothetical protein
MQRPAFVSISDVGKDIHRSNCCVAPNGQEQAFIYALCLSMSRLSDLFRPFPRASHVGYLSDVRKWVDCGRVDEWPHFLKWARNGSRKFKISRLLPTCFQILRKHLLSFFDRSQMKKYWRKDWQGHRLFRSSNRQLDLAVVYPNVQPQI